MGVGWRGFWFGEECGASERATDWKRATERRGSIEAVGLVMDGDFMAIHLAPKKINSNVIHTWRDDDAARADGLSCTLLLPSPQKQTPMAGATKLPSSLFSIEQSG